MTSQVARLGVSGLSTAMIVVGDPDFRRLVIESMEMLGISDELR